MNNKYIVKKCIYFQYVIPNLIIFDWWVLFAIFHRATGNFIVKKFSFIRRYIFCNRSLSKFIRYFSTHDIKIFWSAVTLQNTVKMTNYKIESKINVNFHHEWKKIICSHTPPQHIKYNYLLIAYFHTYHFLVILVEATDLFILLLYLST